MNKLFSAKLLERVLVAFVVAFVAAYGSSPLGSGRDALVAAAAAAVQLALSTLVAPHVGDPNSPGLLPGALVDRLRPALKQAAADVVEAAVAAESETPPPPAQ